ncbi:MAG: glycosyltransferase family 39 protein [Curvibacter sp.]|nr:glycosyltransferase family 39 protein [Curvibacter sp.]
MNRRCPSRRPLAAATPQAGRAQPWLLLGLLALALVWLGSLATRSLITPDEGRYATISLGMLQSGNWITPRLNGLLYFEKPPLQYWGGALAMALFGVNDFSARLWSGLAGLATVALVGHTGRRLWGERAGRLAWVVMAGTTWLVLNSHFLSLDAGLCATLTLALCGFLLAQHDQARGQARSPWMLAAWLGLALAVLSKGLVGLLIPGAVLVLHSLWRLDFRIWRAMRWLSGGLLFMLVTVPWFWVVSRHNPDFAWFFFIHEHFDRYLDPSHNREGPWWYFLPFLALGFMPWTSALPWLARVRRADFAEGFLLLWAGFVLLFFSASSSKLPSYILPMFPALALLLARRLDQTSCRALARHLWLPLLFWGLGLGAWFGAESLVAADSSPAIARQLLDGLALASVLFVLAAVLAWRLLRQERKTLAVALVALTHGLGVLIALQAHDGYGLQKSSAALVHLIPQARDPAVPVYALRSYDQTLPFYLGRPVTLVDYVDEFEFGETHEPGRWLPRLEDFVPRWNAEPQAVAYMEPATHELLSKLGLPMRTVYEDDRRVLVVKP